LQDGENLSDALGVLQSATHSSSANYLLAHSDGLVVDARPTKRVEQNDVETSG
jgi:hypothetical protein